LLFKDPTDRYKNLTENTVTVQRNHRQTKDKIPNPKENFTTNTKSTIKIT